MKSSPATESISAGAWPALPLEGWAETYATVHLWSQVVGKVALALAPPINHSWGIALHLTPRGLTTLPLPHGVRTFTMAFDFVDHALVVAVSDGATWRLALEPRPVADFYAQVMAGLRELGLPVKIWPVAVELPSPIDHARAQRLPVRLRRQIEPGALLLGRVRSGGDAFLGTAGAAAGRPGVHARGVLT
jgi:hypothetical protein